MKVTIRWREVNDYTSTVDVDDDEFAAFFAEVKENQPDAQMSEGWVKEFLDADVNEGWFEQCDTNRDYDGTAERDITNVESYEGSPV